MTFKRTLLAVLLGFALGCKANPPPAAQHVTVTLGQALVGLNALGTWVAQEQHYFDKRGLDVKLPLIRGDTQAVQTLLAGGADFVVVGSVAAVGASAEGADLVSLATLGPTMPYLLVGSADVKSPKDLPGKRIGVSGTGLSVSRAALEIAFQHLGLDRKRDNMVFLPAGSANERLVALTTGGIHATVLSVGQFPRVTKLVQEGKLHVLSDLSKLPVVWDHDYLLVTTKYRDAHPDVVENVLKSILEAHAFILNPENKAAVTASIGKNLGYDQDQDLGTDEIYSYVPSTIVAKPYSSEAAVKTLVDTLKDEFPNLSKVDVSRLLDRRFLQKLDTSGFIDSLYKPGAIPVAH